MSDGLTFVSRCPHCGQVLERVPVEGDAWRQAEAWCYLAHRSHHCTTHPEQRKALAE